jgi:hypothetical protein
VSGVWGLAADMVIVGALLVAFSRHQPYTGGAWKRSIQQLLLFTSLVLCCLGICATLLAEAEEAEMGAPNGALVALVAVLAWAVLGLMGFMGYRLCACFYREIVLEKQEVEKVEKAVDGEGGGQGGGRVDALKARVRLLARRALAFLRRKAAAAAAAFILCVATALERLGGGAAPGDGEEEWVECLDAVSGCAYYYNTRTEKTSWDDPRPAQAADGAGAAESEWEELLDADSGYLYYYNTRTEETSWEDPRPAQQWSNVNPLHPLPGESGGSVSNVNPLHEQPGDSDSGGAGQQLGFARTPSLTAGGFALARCLDSQPLSGSRGGPQTKLAGNRARRAEEMRARLGVAPRRVAPPKRPPSRESGLSRLLTVASMKRPRSSLTSSLRERSEEVKSATSAFAFSKAAGGCGAGLGRLSALGVVAADETGAPGQSSEQSQGDADAVSFTRVEDRSQLSLHNGRVSVFNGQPLEEAVL